MKRSLVYVDTSAFVKVPLDEPEADVLLEALDGRPLVASRLVEVEACRVAARLGEEHRAAIDAELAALSLVPLDEAVLEHARRLAPSSLGTLDALHLATALSIAAVDAMATYDRALGEAAEAAGLTLIAPVAS